MKILFTFFLLYFFSFLSWSQDSINNMECRGQDDENIIVGQCIDGEFRGFPYDMNSLKIYTGKCELGSENIVSEINSGNTINLICPYSKMQRLIDQKPIKEQIEIKEKEHKKLKEESKRREEQFQRNLDEKQEDKEQALEKCIRMYGTGGEWDEINNVWIPKAVPTYHIENCKKEINDF